MAYITQYIGNPGPNGTRSEEFASYREQEGHIKFLEDSNQWAVDSSVWTGENHRVVRMVPTTMEKRLAKAKAREYAKERRRR